MIEQRFKESIDRYISTGCPTGDFLRAVLENDLTEAVGRADESAIWNLRDIVVYLYNEVPSASWGSKEKVKAWRDRFIHKTTEHA